MNALLQCAVYLGVLLLLAKPLGAYMANVYEGRYRFLAPLENLVYRSAGVRAEEEMDWKRYLWGVLWFNLIGFAAVYALQRLQHLLPLNPQKFGAVSADSSFNTAVSFITNTNWQGYGGESTMSYLTQMLGLSVQNFFSAATGMAVLIALTRGFARKQTQGLGNVWADLTRTTLYILLPLSLLLAGVLVTQGVVQTFEPYKTVDLVQQPLEQTLPLGPAASQIAIKQLGSNGGGFFNANSAHPYENPTPLSNFLEMLAILLISGALCYTFGRMVGDTRQGWALLAAMTVVFVGFLAVCLLSEQAGNPALGLAPNMEGKEVRFGITNSAIWATATTAASNGSVNSMHDSFTPLGGLVPLALIQLGEIIFGGVGSGLYGMLVFAIVAVFVAGLMVGRTPEYLGKKIESFEMKMASLAVLFPFAVVLIGTGIAVLVEPGRAGIANPGAHGFAEILYGFSSAGNNNGSAFAGLSANTPFYNTALGIVMWISRYWLIVPVLAIAGSLARKKLVPASPGTLPTHTPLFIAFLVGTILILGALTFVPALALGPIVEHLQLWSR
jgi:K+-transporting ATPase ATPase A chain